MSQAIAKALSDPPETQAPTSRPVWQRLVWTATAVYWIAMFVGTHWPKGPHLPISGGDKVMHFSAYLGLALLLSLSTLSWWPVLWLKSIGIVGLLACYGAFDEMTQPLVGRDCELLDWCADMTGVLLAVGLWLWFVRTLCPPRQPGRVTHRRVVPSRAARSHARSRSVSTPLLSFCRARTRQIDTAVKIAT